MRTMQSAVIIALAMASAAAVAQPLDVKLGLWESTVTTETTGTPPVDTGKMTAEQKARYEAAMKAQQARGPRTRVHKSCMTKEKLERDPVNDNERDGCTRTMVSSTSTQWHAKIQCTGKTQRNGDIRVEAVSREHLKGTVQMKAGDDSHAMTVHATIDNRWLGPSCGNVR